MGQRHRTKLREDLSGEHRWGDVGQAFFALIFLTVWILDTFYLQFSIGLNQYIPGAWRIVVGIILILVAGIVASLGLSIVFGEIRDPPRVIRKSVFGIVRHPIYLSEILLYLGLIALSLSLAAAAICCLASVFLHVISKHEEHLLLDRFGKDYEAYMREVPMWIPRLRLIRR